MPSVKPIPGSIENFQKTAPDAQPIVMINLLKYRKNAQYPEETSEIPCTGREAYKRYQSQVVPILKAMNAKPTWMGNAQAAIIAPENEQWDDGFWVQYPSKEAFVQMVASPDYQKHVIHRMAALEDSRLIATASGMHTP